MGALLSLAEVKKHTFKGTLVRTFHRIIHKMLYYKILLRDIHTQYLSETKAL
ncbi:hypothetical protein SAMN05421760_110113 [Neptunomonas antarctica]|uniref:Uncharacterized protein n=1 Tax=Neptunomonas antarctica TaxID=619304 RepID=A0A1N7NPL1_9GAMM|nr:hypothetical protein SAMN05421760_110113 [Neptunomonas antarctica]